MSFSCRKMTYGPSRDGSVTMVSELTVGPPFITDELPGGDPNITFSDPKFVAGLSAAERIDIKCDRLESGMIALHSLIESRLRSFPPIAFNTDRSEICDLEIKFTGDLGNSTPSVLIAFVKEIEANAIADEAKGDNLAPRSFRPPLSVDKQIEAGDLPLRSQICHLQLGLNDLDAPDPFLQAIAADPCHFSAAEEPKAMIGASDLSSRPAIIEEIQPKTPTEPLFLSSLMHQQSYKAEPAALSLLIDAVEFDADSTTGDADAVPIVTAVEEMSSAKPQSDSSHSPYLMICSLNQGGSVHDHQVFGVFLQRVRSSIEPVKGDTCHEEKQEEFSVTQPTPQALHSSSIHNVGCPALLPNLLIVDIDLAVEDSASSDMEQHHLRAPRKPPWIEVDIGMPSCYFDLRTDRVLMEGMILAGAVAERLGVCCRVHQSPISGLFGFDSFANVALQVNLIIYFIGIMHLDIASASNELTNLLGTSYIASVVISYMADTVVGRFKVALVSAGIEFLGLCLLTVQAHYPALKPPECNVFVPTSVCEEVGGGNSVLMYAALYLIAVGMAGVKAGVPSHGADQFSEEDPEEVLSMSSFFNWFLLSSCIGGAFSVTFVIWIQAREGWDWGFGVSAIGMLLGIVIFVAGIPRYRIHVIRGISPITELIQVFVASIRNRKLQLPDDPEELHEISRDKESAVDMEFITHRDMLRFLDKAAIQPTMPSENTSPWNLCTVTQVERQRPSSE